MRILLSGATGFVGSALRSYLTQKGSTVIPLIRGASREGSIGWDPEAGRLRKEDFEGFDAVIHLAGEPIMGRWSADKKERILLSRTMSTLFLSTILAQLYQPPKVFLSASAVGFYGDRGEELLTEKSREGRGFLARVCTEWEKASLPIENRGARTLHTRFGIVIGKGGALQKMLLPYKLGLGGRLGSGHQWMSWIALDDLVRAIELALHDETLEGPVNLVSPHPIRQADFSKTLASLLHRPALLNQPAWFLRLLFGEMADEMLLASARAEPTKLLAADFHFHLPHIRDALKKALQKAGG
jgi:hypothetical protein